MRNARWTAARTVCCGLAALALAWTVPPVAVASAGVQFSLSATVEGRLDRSAVADFDGDGKPDLAATENSVQQLAVLLGDGRGRVTTRVVTPLGGDPVALADGDFNRDGKPDVAVARDSDHAVAVLLGDGTGHFRTLKSVPVAAASLAVADFNRDGTPDLAAGGTSYSCPRPASVGPNVLLGDGAGAGAFRPLDTSCSTYAPSLAVADFNRDGAPDAAQAATYEGDLVLLGNGRGQFSPVGDIGLANEPSWVVAADFNRDGGPDLAFRYESTHDHGGPQAAGTAIFLSDGSGQFRHVSTVAEMDPVVGDFNGDGTPDLVGRQGVLAGDGTGHFKRIATRGFGGGAALAVADFNGDAKPDLAARRLLGMVPDALLLNTTRFSPLVATGRARHVTPESAHLPGTVDPRGNATRYRFSYGRTRRHSQTTRWQSAGSAKRELSVSVRVAHLRRGTRYHYRLIARNGEGTTRGRDRTFATRP